MGGLQGCRGTLRGPREAGSGVLRGCRCSSASASLTLLKRQATEKHWIEYPQTRAEEVLGSPQKINSYFKDKRQARGLSQRRPHYFQGWKANLQRPKIRQKAGAGDIQTWK